MQKETHCKRVNCVYYKEKENIIYIYPIKNKTKPPISNWSISLSEFQFENGNKPLKHEV